MYSICLFSSGAWLDNDCGPGSKMDHATRRLVHTLAGKQGKQLTDTAFV
jgi:hypothetical protein